LKLSHTGTLTEDTHRHFYSEAFVLLPVSEGYTNVTITGNQVTLPHLSELISPEENNQILYDETRTHRTLGTLENVARRSSPTTQQSYVELRDVLATNSNQFTWVCALIAFSIFLSFVVLTSRCWRRPFLILFHRNFPRQKTPRPPIDLEMARLSRHPRVARVAPKRQRS
jgi:hypothetical protein